MVQQYHISYIAELQHLIHKIDQLQKKRGRAPFEGRSGTKNQSGWYKNKLDPFWKRSGWKKACRIINKQVGFALKQVWSIYYYKPGTKSLHQSTFKQMIKQQKQLNGETGRTWRAGYMNSSSTVSAMGGRLKNHLETIEHFERRWVNKIWKQQASKAEYSNTQQDLPD